MILLDALDFYNRFAIIEKVHVSLCFFFKSLLFSTSLCFTPFDFIHFFWLLFVYGFLIFDP